MRRPSVISVANEKVSIVTVCQMVGVDLPDDVGMGRSRKVHCPFGELYHSDHGASAAMRIYPETNSAWCFSCKMYFTATRLAAQAWDQDEEIAATTLLDRIGYKPVDLAQAWAQAATYEPPPDRALLADALKTYCRRIQPEFTHRQFEPAVASLLTRCLALLDLVQNDDDVTTWLTYCKAAMRRTLHTAESADRHRREILSGTERPI